MGIVMESTKDLLEGADAIAGYLKARGFRAMSVKRVYHLRERGGWPIVRLPGTGLMARKSELDTFIDRAFESASAEGENGDGEKAPVAHTERRIRSVGR